MKLDEKTRKAIKKVFQKYPAVLAVYLYGSQAKGYANKSSDLDMAVVVDDVTGLDHDKLYLKVREIIKGVELDLRIATLKSDLIYLFEVIGGKYLYQKSEIDRIRFETQVLRNFYDNQHIRDIYYRYLKQSFGVS